jgi:uncharacterized protein YdgA (DUF945 family)
MNKLATATAAAAALLIVGLPPVFGMLTEAQVRARVAEISRSGLLTAEIRSYERGWFGGLAKIDLALAPQYAAQLAAASAAGRASWLGGLADRTAPLEVELGHGPVAFLDGVHFGLSRMTARLDPALAAVANLERRLNVPHLLAFRGRTGFFGKLSFDADVPPVDLDLASIRVRFSGALLDGTLAGKKLAAHARADRLEVASAIGGVTLEGASADIDNEILSRYRLPGNAGFAIRSLSIVGAPRGANPALDVAGLRVDSTVALGDADLLDVRASFRLDSASADGAEVVDASVGIAFRKLDAAALDAYATALRGRATGGAASPDEALRTLQPAIARLLVAGPSVALDPVSFRYDGEPFAGRAEILTNAAALASALTPNGAVDFGDPVTLLRLFDGSAEVDVSKKLAQQLTQLAIQARYANDATTTPDQQRRFAEASAVLALAALAGQGLLEDTGEGYRSALRVRNGGVTVNGAVLPLSVP